MHSFTTPIDSSPRASRLHDWQNDRQRRNFTLRAKMVLIGSAALVVAIFLFCIWRPLATPKLRIVSIGSLEQFHQFAQTIPTAIVGSLVSTSQMNGTVTRSWFEGTNRKQPILIHAVGIATVKDQRALLQPGTTNTATGYEPFDVSELLRRLGSSQSPAIVVLDAIEQDWEMVGHLPEVTAWRFARCIDRELDQIQHAQVMVVVQHSRVYRELHDHPHAISPLTQRLIRGFSSAADHDQDRVITAGEWLDVVAPSVRDRRDSRAPQSFSTVKRSKWNQIRLTPVVDQAVETVADAESITFDQQIADVATPDSTATDSNRVKIAVTAPTLALAVELQAAAIDTNRSEQCNDLFLQLQQQLNADAVEQDAVAWLQTPKLANAQWDEILWMQKVLEQDVSWALKQNLLRSRILANQLATKLTVRNWFPNQWEVAQWTRLDAERSLVSPVRQENAAYVLRQSRQAVRYYQTLHRQCDQIDRASLLCEQVRGDVQELVSLSIRASSPRDDDICQLLQDANDLQSWMDHRRGDAMEQCKMLVDSLTNRRASAQKLIDHELRLQAGHDLSRQVIGLSNRFVEKTKIRIARSLLATQIQQGSSAPLACKKLKAASQQAIAMLSNSTRMDRATDDAITDFQDEMKTITLAKHLPASVDAKQTLLDQSFNHWSKIVGVLADETCEFAADATSDQRSLLEQTSSRYQRLAVGLGSGIVAQLDTEFQIRTMMQGSLVTSESVLLDIDVKQLSETMVDGRLEIEIDPGAIQIAGDTTSSTGVTVRPVEGMDYHAVATQRLEQASAMANRRAHRKARIELTRTSMTSHDTAVNIRWITKQSVYRASVPLQMPLPPIVSVQFDNDQTGGQSAGFASGQAAPVWVMHANRTQFRRLLVNAAAETRDVQVRMLAWADPTIVAPPPMKKEQADRWLSRRTEPMVLANHPSLAVKQGTPVSLLFPPKKLDPSAPKMSIGTLLCEVTDLERKIVQMVDLRPQVYRPSALVRPAVSFDHTTQRITVDLQEQSASPDVDPYQGPTQIQLEIVDRVTDKVVANGALSLRSGQRQTKELNAAACQGHPICLRVLVDGWPSAFVYELSGDRSQSNVLPSDDRAAISIVRPTDQIVTKGTAESVAAEVWVDFSDSVFRYGKDTVTLGLDLNGDRYLHGEPETSIQTPVAIGFQWAGVDAQGSIGLTSLVGPHRLTVPVGMLRDRRVSLIARLQRGEAVDWSEPLAIVIDDLPPKVHDIQILSPLPAVLGLPIDMRISIDDAGLSGAAAISAGWATTGQLEFTAKMKLVAGQRLQDDRWAITLPTDTLASGVHSLLVQPTDAAGNIGKVKALTVEVRTEEELAKMRLEQATSVRGSVAFVKKPIGGMKVSLTRQSEENQENPAGYTDAPTANASNSPLEVQTQADGTFVFPDVTVGQYELRVEGLYKGMRRRKTLRVAVKPPEPATIPTIRID